MTTLTPDQQLTLPVNTDINDVPTHMTLYNAGVERRLFKRYLSTADRTARNPSPQTGEISILLNTGEIDVFFGGAWSCIGFVGKGQLDTQNFNQSGGLATNIGVTTYVNANGSVSFTKILASSRLLVRLGFTCYGTTTPPWELLYGVNINSIDYDVGKLNIGTANVHAAAYAERTISGIAAGAYTVQVRMKNSNAAKTTILDNGDVLSLTVSEIL